MDILRPVKAFDAYQQKHTWLAIPMAVVRKFGNDQAGNLAALVAYYAFFSLFPLLLVFLTILGYVLQGHPSELTSVENSIKANFPGLSKNIAVTALQGHVVALVIGLATSLYSGLGVTNAAQNAFDRVWAVPFKDRPDFLRARLRGLGLLLAVGLLFIVATGASGLVTGGFGGPLAKVAGICVSLLVNLVLFFVAFRLMTARSVKTRCLRVGVVFAAVFWTILQAVGGLYISHVLKHMSPAYASVGTVIALLVWLHLGAQITLYAAEINVVLERKLYPRSLMGPPVEEADRKALRDLAKVEERHDSERVEVEFDGAEDGDQNSRSDASRRVIDSGQEQSDPSAGQPRQTARRGS